MSKLEKQEWIILETRPYQNDAILSLLNFVKELLRWTLDRDVEKIFKNSALLNMATWTWKTYTVWEVLDILLSLRNRFNWVFQKQIFEKLNIIVLTHRIDLINQFRDDLIFWRDWKHSILSEKILEWLHTSTYHSKADNSDGNLDTEEIDMWKWINNDTIVFSTYQTAELEKIIDKMEYIDIILVDEAHNIKCNSIFHKVVNDLSKKTRNWEESLIIPITATPNNHTIDLFWKEIFNFGLAKYLASEYSPDIIYNLVTNINVNNDELELLKNIIDEARLEEDYSAKKYLVKNAEEIFDKIMWKFVSKDELVNDLFNRVWNNWEFEETVIFCNTIKECDELSTLINNKNWIEWYALPFHSKGYSDSSLNKFKNENNECKIILAVWKLNEGIDLPIVKNVVFWRWTDSGTVFLQQFWRWLRWNETVKYYDYVWWIKNFTWISGIHEEYWRYIKSDTNWNWISENKKRNKFTLLSWNDIDNKIWLESNYNEKLIQHNINLWDLGIEISKIHNGLDVTKEEIQDYFINYEWNNKNESYDILKDFSLKDIESKIFIKWKSISYLLKKSWWPNNKNISINTQFWFRSFLRWLFKIDENIWKEKIESFFKNYEWKTEKESFEYLYKFNNYDALNISFRKIDLFSLILLYTKWEIKSWTKFTMDLYRKFLCELFNRKYNLSKPKKNIQLFDRNNEILKKEDIIKYLKKYRSIEETKKNLNADEYIVRDEDTFYNYLYNLPLKEVKKIEYKWNSIFLIISFINWDIRLKRTGSHDLYKDCINSLFNKDLSIIYYKEFEDFFLKHKGYSENELYNYFYNLDYKKFKNIKVSGKSIDFVIKTILWIKENVPFELTYRLYKDAIKKIYKR